MTFFSLQSILLLFSFSFFSCTNFNSGNEGSTKEKPSMDYYSNVKQHQELRDTLIVSTTKTDKYAVVEIQLIQENKKHINLDTFRGLFPSVEAKLSNDSVGVIKYNYGIGQSVSKSIYKIKLKSQTFYKYLYNSISNGTLRISVVPINLSFDNFSEENISDLITVDEEYKISIETPLNLSTKGGNIDLTSLEQFVKQAYDQKNDYKLNNCCNQDILPIIENYLSYSDTNNIISLNNIAYYLEQEGVYQDAIYILSKILEAHPNRTVAYLNLADAYWGNGQLKKAKQAYTTYVNQMKEQSELDEVTPRVYDRLQSTKF